MKKRNYSKRAGNKKKKRYRPIKVLFYAFVTTLNVFSALLLIISAYSDRISPQKGIIFAYLGLIFPILILANICFFVYWIIAKKWLQTFILIVIFAVCWKPFSVFCPFHFKTKNLPREDMIKVLSYNVMSFAFQNHTTEKPNKIIQYIAESEADIVCLQEYSVSTRANRMSSQTIAKALPMYPYRAEIFFSPSDNNKYGLALLSKYPIISSKRISYPSLYNGSAIHILNVRGETVTVINNHLESFKLTAEDRTKYSDMFTNVSFESLDEFRNAVQQKIGRAFRIRASQAETIANEIGNANSNYTIVCGDFNDTPISYAHRTIRGTLADAYAKSGFGIGISYNQNLFFFRIDHILHSSNMNAYNCCIDKRINLSDHYPIHCFLKLN